MIEAATEVMKAITNHSSKGVHGGLVADDSLHDVVVGGLRVAACGNQVALTIQPLFAELFDFL